MRRKRSAHEPTTCAGRPTQKVSGTCSSASFYDRCRAIRILRPTEDVMRRKSSFPKAVLLATCVLTTLVLVPAAARGEGNLTLYCSPQIEWCQLVIAEFTKATRTNVPMTRNSSGETIAQIKAEASKPTEDRSSRCTTAQPL